MDPITQEYRTKPEAAAPPGMQRCPRGRRRSATGMMGSTVEAFKRDTLYQRILMQKQQERKSPKKRPSYAIETVGGRKIGDSGESDNWTRVRNAFEAGEIKVHIPPHQATVWDQPERWRNGGMARRLRNCTEESA